MTHDPKVLRELADRCEREQPSDELNWAIMEAVMPDHGRTQAILYGQSLDSAVTLVPKGWKWSLQKSAAATKYNASVWEDSRNPRTSIFNRSAATPALALCSTSLRALASQGDKT